MKSVCVFTGSSFGFNPAYEQAAVTLGRAIASREMTLVYGGASVGLMGAVADAALNAGGRVVGVLPKALADLEIAHTQLTDLEIVGSMHERKQRMADQSDAFIAMPGGLGTLEEVFEVWTWSQLGVHAKPIGFLNVDSYYNTLFEFLDSTVTSGFVRESHCELAEFDDDADSLLNKLSSVQVRQEAKWIGRAET